MKREGEPLLHVKFCIFIVSLLISQLGYVICRHSKTHALTSISLGKGEWGKLTVFFLENDISKN